MRTDLEAIFDRLVREREAYYIHTYEGDDDMPARTKSTLVGTPALTLPVCRGRISLGTWQGIFTTVRNSTDERRPAHRRHGRRVSVTRTRSTDRRHSIATTTFRNPPPSSRS